jgi:plasmid stabilization system protein ParE
VTRLVWTAEAVSDLESIRDFIAQTSPHYANVVVAGLVEAMDRVRVFPESGRTVPELRRRDVREVIRGSHRIVYRVRSDGDAVEVLTVFRASRAFPEAEVAPDPGRTE